MKILPGSPPTAFIILYLLELLVCLLSSLTQAVSSLGEGPAQFIYGAKSRTGQVKLRFVILLPLLFLDHLVASRIQGVGFYCVDGKRI